MTIIKPSTAFKTGADWNSSEVRSYMTDQTPIHVDTVAMVRDNDFEKARLLYVVSKTAFYRLDLSSGADDDGDTVLRDNVGRRYVKVPGSDGAKTWDVQVDDLTARAAYDDEDAGFVVLVSDTGDGRAALYTMGDGGSGDWIGPAYQTGAEGDAGKAYESYAVSIFKSDGIETGGYYADRRANAANVQDTIYAEIIDGDEGAEIDLYLEVDGVPAYGPFTVEVGTPVTATDLGIAVAEADTVNWVVTAIIGGDVRDVFAKSYGAVSA